MIGDLIGILFVGTPVIVILFFVICLIQFLAAVIRNKKQPGSVTPEELKWKRTMFIISCVTLVVGLGIVIGIIALLATAIAFM